MKLSALLTAFLLCATSAFASGPWTAAATKVRDSIVYLESAGGSCSGFVIDATRRYVMTAAHCEGEKMFVDQMPAFTIAKDAKNDILILRVPNLDRPALKLAAHNPDVGDEVASYGYGYGLEKPLFRVHHISDPRAEFPQGNGEYVFYDSAFVPGQSGCPAFNQAGEVVGIVQMASPVVGIGKGAEQIRDKFGRYFQK